ncbi:hypothetical protein EVAR_18551_1 [Eumeta japonica]|uniref:Uncharacterized protein n=1 Tax=Eumeta variegata TaxID=151549 RepID=A0A4C1V2M5_EUMVA|nr:hypothetical protein EVAR_18551_1 [Eumeta japonica]
MLGPQKSPLDASISNYIIEGRKLSRRKIGNTEQMSLGSVHKLRSSTKGGRDKLKRYAEAHNSRLEYEVSVGFKRAQAQAGAPPLDPVSRGPPVQDQGRLVIDRRTRLYNTFGHGTILKIESKVVPQSRSGAKLEQGLDRDEKDEKRQRSHDWNRN